MAESRECHTCGNRISASAGVCWLCSQRQVKPKQLENHAAAESFTFWEELLFFRRFCGRIMFLTALMMLQLGLVLGVLYLIAYAMSCAMAPPPNVLPAN